MLTHPTQPCPQLVSDLGQVFKLIGGSTGAFFIFGMPGAFLIQVSSSSSGQPVSPRCSACRSCGRCGHLPVAIHLLRECAQRSAYRPPAAAAKVPAPCCAHRLRLAWLAGWGAAGQPLTTACALICLCRRRHPNLILVDTSVIAAAPKRLLVSVLPLVPVVQQVHQCMPASPLPPVHSCHVWLPEQLRRRAAAPAPDEQVAGIGDALATYFEVRCAGTALWTGLLKIL